MDAMFRFATLSAAAALLSAATAFVFADESVSTRRSLAAQRHWVKFAVVQGRVTVLNAQFGQSLSATFSDPDADVHEVFSVNVSAGSPAVHYELTTGRMHLAADFLDDGRAVIECDPRGDSTATKLRYRQPSKGPVALEVGAGSSRQRYQAESFWHLMLQQPEACKRHLLPILQSLRPGWRLAETAGGIEAALLDAARTAPLPDRKSMATLVADMGGKSFHQRCRAERELRRMGLPALAYLERLDASALDTEQQMRVKRLIAALSGRRGDTPRTASAYLLDNSAVWLILASRDNAATRRLAAVHLARVTGRSIDFDHDADQSVRREQIARLRRQIGYR